MKWATLLKEIKEKVGLPQSSTAASIATTVSSPSSPASSPPSSDCDANASSTHYDFASSLSSRDKHELELDFNRFWEEFGSSNSEKEKEMALSLTVDAFCRLVKQHANAAQLVTQLVETHKFSFVVGRAFVTGIEKLKISSKIRSLDVSQVIQFFSEATKDGISTGSNLMTAVEVLVSGPFDKQALLDCGIFCCLIQILNALLSYDEANKKQTITNSEESLLIEKDSVADFGQACLVEVEGIIVHIMKVLASYPSAAQSLTEDDSLMLLFQIVSNGSLFAFSRYKEGLVSPHIIQLHKHAMQILGLLLVNDNGSMARYIRKHHLDDSLSLFSRINSSPVPMIKVLLVAVKDFNPDCGDPTYTVGIVDLLLECVELSYRQEAGGLSLREDIHNAHGYHFLVQFALVLSTIPENQGIESIYLKHQTDKDSGSNRAQAFDDVRERDFMEKEDPSSEHVSPTLSRLLDILVNLAHTGPADGKRSKYSYTKDSGHSRSQTLSTESLGDEIWEEENNRVKDLEAVQMLQDIFLKADSMNLQAEVLNRMFKIFLSHPENYKLCQQVRTVPLLILNMAAFPSSLQEKILKILEYSVTVVNCAPEQELLSLCCLLQQPITSELKVTILSFFVKLLSFDQQYKKVLREVGVLEVLLGGLKQLLGQNQHDVNANQLEGKSSSRSFKKHFDIEGVIITSPKFEESGSGKLPIFEAEETIAIAWDCMVSLVKDAEASQASFRSANGVTTILPFLVSSVHRPGVLRTLSCLITEDVMQGHPEELGVLIEVIKSGMVTSVSGHQYKLQSDVKCDTMGALWRILGVNSAARRVFGEASGFSLLLTTLHSFQGHEGRSEESSFLDCIKEFTYLLRLMTVASLSCCVDYETQVIQLLLELALEITLPPFITLESATLANMSENKFTSFPLITQSGLANPNEERVYNAGSIRVLIRSVLLFTPKVQLEVLNLIEKLARSGPFNLENLTSVGCVELVLETIHPFLSGSSLFLSYALKIVEVLGAYRLSASELRTLARYILQTRLIKSGHTIVNMMARLILMEDMGLKTVSLAPFVEMGMNKVGHGSFQVPLGERSWPPAAGYSFHHDQQVLWIFSVGTVNSDNTFYAELYLQEDGVLTLATGNSCSLSFSGLELEEDQWHHLAIVHSKPNALAGFFQDSIAYVYLDGKLMQTGKLGYSPSPMGKPLQVTIGTPITAARISDLTWRLRSCYLFEEVLTPGCICFMYILGRGYRGIFQDADLLRFVPYQACGGGSMAILDTLDADLSVPPGTQKLDSANKQGDSKADGSGIVWDLDRLGNLSFELSGKKLIFAFDGTCTEAVRASGTSYMLNLVDPLSAAASPFGGIPRFGRLRGDIYICRQCVIGDTIRSVGGMSVILALVEAAGTRDAPYGPCLEIILQIAACEASFSEPSKLECIQTFASPTETIQETSFEDLNLSKFRDRTTLGGTQFDMDDFSSLKDSFSHTSELENADMPAETSNCIVLSNADTVEHVLLDWTLWVTAPIPVQIALLSFLEQLVSVHCVVMLKFLLWKISCSPWVILEDGFLASELENVVRFVIMSFDPPEMKPLQQIMREPMGKHVIVRNLLLEMLMDLQVTIKSEEMLEQFHKMPVYPRLPEVRMLDFHALVPSDGGHVELKFVELLESIIAMAKTTFDRLSTQSILACQTGNFVQIVAELVEEDADMTEELQGLSEINSHYILFLFYVLVFTYCVWSNSEDGTVCQTSTSAGSFPQPQISSTSEEVLPSDFSAEDKEEMNTNEVTTIVSIQNRQLTTRFTESVSVSSPDSRIFSELQEDVQVNQGMDGDSVNRVSSSAQMRLTTIVSNTNRQLNHQIHRVLYLFLVQILAFSLINSIPIPLTPCPSPTIAQTPWLSSASSNIDLKNLMGSSMFTGYIDQSSDLSSLVPTATNTTVSVIPKILLEMDDSGGGGPCSGGAAAMLDFIAEILADISTEQIKAAQFVENILEMVPLYVGAESMLVFQGLFLCRLMNFIERRLLHDDEEDEKKLDKIKWSSNLDALCWMIVDRVYMGAFPQPAAVLKTLEFLLSMLQLANKDGRIEEAAPTGKGLLSISRENRPLEAYVHSILKNTNRMILYCFLPPFLVTIGEEDLLFSLGLLPEPKKRSPTNSSEEDQGIDICKVLQLLFAHRRIIFCPTNLDIDLNCCLCVNLICLIRDQRQNVQNLAIDVVKYLLVHRKASLEDLLVSKPYKGQRIDVLHGGFDKLLTGNLSAFFDWLWTSEDRVKMVLEQCAAIMWMQYISGYTKFPGVRIKGMDVRRKREMGRKSRDTSKVELKHREQVNERRCKLEGVRDTMSTELRVVRQDKYGWVIHAESEWQTHLQQLVHVRGIFPIRKPSSSEDPEWQLCPIEGPYRMRKKLECCKVRINSIQNVLDGQLELGDMELPKVKHEDGPDVSDSDSKAIFNLLDGIELSDESLYKGPDDMKDVTSVKNGWNDDKASSVTEVSLHSALEYGAKSSAVSLPTTESIPGRSEVESPRLAPSIRIDEIKVNEDKLDKELQNDSEYLIRPYLEPLEKIRFRYNCERVVGLDKIDGIFLIGELCLYVIESFYIDDSGCICEKESEDELSVIDQALGVKKDVTGSMDCQSKSTSCWNTTPNTSVGGRYWAYNGGAWGKEKVVASGNLHPWRMWKLDSIHEILRRDYQLRPVSIELFSMDGYNDLLVFHKIERDEVFRNLVAVNLPRNIMLDTMISGTTKQETYEGGRLFKITAKSFSKRWQNGEISNFQYLMHLNTLAGRGYSDLTQYPVFPWVLANYESDNLDLSDPNTFRKLEKPMGCQTPEGEEEFKTRYESWDDPEVPKFHYGSHYSSAGIVLFYLLRLPPFSAENQKLQGGQFDHADRLFSSIRDTWLSAAGKGNTSDVKELIPEFFYMPEFLENSFSLDLGEKQSGEKVGDVHLPPWAKGSAREFIRLHREALESEFVSGNLHNWIDLIFGYKQRGKAAEKAANVFYHYTYEGSVDIDTVTDPSMKASILAQINHFGQTPKQLFLKPHVKRRSDRKLPPHPLKTPTLLVPHEIRKSSYSITQIVSFQERILIGKANTKLKPRMYSKYVAWGFPDLSLRFLSFDQDRLLSTHENLHLGNQTQCAGFSHDGHILVTGTDDGLVYVWRISEDNPRASSRLLLEKVLCAHRSKIMSSRQQLPEFPAPVSAVYVNDLTGEIMTAAGTLLAVWSINGCCLAVISPSQMSSDYILSATSSTFSDWLDTNWYVTGHNGSVKVWQMVHRTDIETISNSTSMGTGGGLPLDQSPEYRLLLHKVLTFHEHPVTSLFLTTDLKQLLSGDSGGHLLSWTLPP
ncbi:WD repeat and FYVE domain-containing protein 3-like isoform X2 [Hibiscus syriacus]|uniref:WD repeat and FYVE domain-containing protein 3-like isoform X2 n=1 Tax=Hibiscus syriacus TaxID=106335 RepID=A0A6A2YZI6_HIBSY|nr:WD repeat and FYVE domain-containing protein 3-like isoform X2 [Hibiscus syriacus]